MDSTAVLDQLLRLVAILSSAWDTAPNKAAIVSATGLVTWLALVRILRWRRYVSIHHQYEGKWKAGKLTVGEAQRIIATSNVYDIPLLINKALGLALFKTYAIPSISKLLLATKELAAPETVAKRYADTEILIATFVACPLSGFHDVSVVPNSETPAEDPRASLALARMNFMHSKYKISNDDYLYTLSLFVLEPSVWTDRHGWRTLSPMEKDAYLLVWQDIGAKMSIQNIPETYEELAAWSKAHEEVHMVPDQTNHEVALHTLDELLFAVPRGPLRSFAERIIFALLEERLRVAMLLPKQPRVIHWIAGGLMNSFWIFQRFFCLPRTDSNPGYCVDIGIPKTDQNGEVRPQRPCTYRSTPWYKEEPQGVLAHVISKLQVWIGYHADVPSAKYHSQGYRVQEMGPHSFEGVGIDEVARNAEKMQRCPISASWAPKSSNTGQGKKSTSP